ncbi:Hsp20/alpha crystallin family protein [Desulfocurvibacter africanus]|uniref:Heat shock protein Hsp20 n=1 Tax=Desulfocurvibacter africanus subsp. africanus str. Walvis Bay TaxID=690850 RepID=F3Z175_DESAF|nr:Hsp20/alpha crystallin family protein [Desulfocurvibacter africanus]EGJ49973.1 heat shock protein Hsp20 [Desulfocurvibacter africanus subsp. africanus str. Walvis Bay]
MPNDVKKSEQQVQQQEKRYPLVRPATDIIEREDGFHIFMDLPGVRREDLIIDLKDNELKVSGKAVHPTQAKGETLALEFTSGEYTRTFTLSDTVNRENIKANMKNGVLELHLPKAEKMQPKRIEIQAG